MLSLIKKVKNILNFTRSLDIQYDEITNSYHIKSSSNIIIQSDGDIIQISRGSNIQIADKIHLNPVDVSKIETRVQDLDLIIQSK